MREVLEKEFVPKHPPLSSNSTLYETLYSTDSVFLGIRRGDYMSERNKNIFHVCTADYYRNAMALMAQKVSDPVFVVFSNDISWVRENIDMTGYKVYYEPEGCPVWETFRLMYSCKHFIISNSTLHWWAQYCSRNEKKVVICPDRWFAPPIERNNLIEDNFIKLSTL